MGNTHPSHASQNPPTNPPVNPPLHRTHKRPRPHKTPIIIQTAIHTTANRHSIIPGKINNKKTGASNGQIHAQNIRSTPQATTSTFYRTLERYVPGTRYHPGDKITPCTRYHPGDEITLCTRITRVIR